LVIEYFKLSMLSGEGFRTHAPKRIKICSMERNFNSRAMRIRVKK